MKSLEDLEDVFQAGIDAWENDIVYTHASVMGHKIVREIKRLTPVDTGNLRRRWFFRVDKATGDVIIWISNDAEYAPHVNNGHRIVRAKKTVGKTKGRHMLEKGMQEY